MASHEGPLKLWVAGKKKWREGYGRVEGRELRVLESVLGGETLGAAGLGEPVKRGAPAEVAPPPGEDNCQFAVGSLLLSAPSFAASSEWVAFLKSHCAAVQEARRGVALAASAPSVPAEPTSLPEACAALATAANGGSQEAVRAVRGVQGLAMAELKRAKGVLQAETRETAASRQLEAAVAELAGLLKELMGAIRLFVDTEAASERERVQQLARDAAETFVRLAEREKALKSKPSSPRASSQAASMPPPSPRDRAATSRLHQQRAPRTALDDACDELIRQAREGPKEAVAATKQVQALAMAQLRAVKAAADVSAAERARVEPEVAAAASALKELVGAVRVYARDGESEQLAEVERATRALAERAAALGQPGGRAATASQSGPLPSLSPRGPTLSMDQLMALADPGSSDGEAPGLPKRSPRSAGRPDLARLSNPENPLGSSSSSSLGGSATIPSLSGPSVAVASSLAPASSLVPAAPEADLAAGLRDPAHRLLGSALQDAVRELQAWWRSGCPGGDDEANRNIRGALCSGLAAVLAYRFRVGRGWLGSWGGSSHFWHWIQDFAANSSVNTVAGLSLQKCLKSLATDERAGPDENARFRAWVAAALNQGKLARWLAETSDPGHAAAAARFYDPGALFLDLHARSVVLEMLRPLEQYKWNLDVHYEWTLRERKRQAAASAQH